MTLYEISPIRQSNRNLKKRWFTCRDMNLVVWFRRKTPVSFQLSFNRYDQEQTISWSVQQGFCLYYSVNLRVNWHKQRSSLANNFNQKDLASLRRNFLVACENIEIGVTDFIYARLMEYPPLDSKLHASQKDHSVLS